MTREERGCLRKEIEAFTQHLETLPLTELESLVEEEKARVAAAEDAKLCFQRTSLTGGN